VAWFFDGASRVAEGPDPLGSLTARLTGGTAGETGRGATSLPSWLEYATLVPSDSVACCWVVVALDETLSIREPLSW